MEDYIEYAIPTSADYWTHESDEVPKSFFERIEKELAGFVSTYWPEFKFSVRLVPETTSYGNRTRSSMEENEEIDMIETIENWMSWRWPDWLAECYEEYNEKPLDFGS